MKSVLLSLSLLLFAGMAPAQTIPAFNDMSAEQTEAFGEAVRNYLLTNPEVIMEAVAVLEQRQQQAAAQTDEDLVRQYAEDLFYDGYSFVEGNPDGQILMVEFIDYKCSFCKRAHPDVKALLAANDDIRLVIKEFPILGAESTLASRAAASVLINDGDDAYYNFYDAVMTFNGPLNEATLTRMATDAGADAELMMQTVNSPLVTQIIQNNMRLAQNMQITGTPTFVLGGQMMRGYVPLAQMQIMVDDLRATLE